MRHSFAQIDASIDASGQAPDTTLLLETRGGVTYRI
jgi:hypothetical protein